MTDEERQRTMDFILQQQASMAAHQEQLKEDRIRNQPHIAELRRDFKRLVELAVITEERMDNGEFRVTALETRSATLEASMAHLTEAQAHADERVSALIDIIIENRNGPPKGRSKAFEANPLKQQLQPKL